MKTHNVLEKLFKHWILDVVCTTVLAAVALSAVLQPAYAQELKPPAVPANIQVPVGNKAFVPYTTDYLFYKKAN